MQESIIEQDTEIQEMTAEEMAQAVRDFSNQAMTVLNERREKAYAAACAPLDEELTALASEASEFEAKSRGVIELIASAQRVRRFEADQLLLAGKAAEAQAKLAELAEVEAAPAEIEQRRREIAERCEQIEAEKRMALRGAAEDFRESVIALIRGAENALASILDGTRDSLNNLETQLGMALYNPADLTAHDRTNEWITLNRLYSGRVR